MVLHDGRLHSDVAFENLILVVDLHTNLEGLTSESLNTACLLALNLPCRIEDWAMVMSLCSGYFGRFRDFIS